jgi:hypothetical protein
VELDDHPVVSQNFSVGTQHNFTEFRIFQDKGPHKVRIWTNKGGAELVREFTENDEDTGIITNWYKPKVSEKRFRFETIKGPIYFV